MLINPTGMYTGGEFYWIRYYNGTHEVRRATPEWEDDNETVFHGSFERCVKWLEDLLERNADYDLNL